MEVVERGGLLMRWEWLRSEGFGDLRPRGQNFLISLHEKCISFFGKGGAPQISHYSYNFRLLSL